MSNSEQIATLGIVPSGPVLIGLDSRNRWEPSYLAVTLSGQATEAHDLHIVPQCQNWSVEIFHADRPFHGIATLLEVERGQNQS